MTERRLADIGIADKLASRETQAPETRAKSLAAKADLNPRRRTQINVVVSVNVRQRLKLAADQCQDSVRTLVEGFILDGLRNLEHELQRKAALNGKDHPVEVNGADE